MRYLHALLLCLLVTNPTSADLITRYDFTGQPAGQDYVAPEPGILTEYVSASNLTLGTGVTLSSSTDAFGATGWTRSSSGIDDRDHFSLTLTPLNGTELSLNRISFNESRSTIGIRAFQIRSSLDGFTTNILPSFVTVDDDTATRSHSFDLSGLVALRGLTSAITLRIYGYAAEGSGGVWRLSNYTGSEGIGGGLTIEGSIVAVAIPEAPAWLQCSLLPVALLGCLLLGRR